MRKIRDKLSTGKLESTHMNKQMLKEFDRLEHAIGDGDPKTLRKAVDDLRGAMSVLSSANDTQVGGTHYKSKAIQPWDFIAINGIPYLEGCAIKYLCRWRDKGGIADLEKAKHYIDKVIELQAEKGVEFGSEHDPL